MKSNSLVNKTKLKTIKTNNQDNKLCYFIFPDYITEVKFLDEFYETVFTYELKFKTKQVLIPLNNIEYEIIKYATIKETTYTKEIRHYVQYISTDIPHKKSITTEEYNLYLNSECLIDIDEKEYTQETKLLKNQNRTNELAEYEASIATVEHLDVHYILSEFEFISGSDVDKKVSLTKVFKPKKVTKYDNLDTEVIKYEQEKETIDYIIDEDKLVYLFSPKDYLVETFISKCDELNILVQKDIYYMSSINYHMDYELNINVINKIKTTVLKLLTTFVDPEFNDLITLSDNCIFDCKESFFLKEVCIFEDIRTKIKQDINIYVNNILKAYLAFMKNRSEKIITKKQNLYLIEQSFIDFENSIMSLSSGSKNKRRIKQLFGVYRGKLKL